jgi:hypothetical protein
MSNQADFKVKNGLVVNTTASFLSTVTAVSTTTGGVQISGGAGIAKDVYIGGTLNIQSTTPATSTNTGALRVTGGVGVGGGLFVGGSVTATNVFIGPWAASTASALTIQSSGAGLGTAGTLNFATGTSVTVVNGVATIQASAPIQGVSAPNLIIEGQGTVLTTVTTMINFVGGGVSSTVNAGAPTEVTISIAGQGFPTGDYGVNEPYAQNSATTDAFGVSLIYNYDCMNPTGYYSYADLGVLP